MTSLRVVQERHTDCADGISGGIQASLSAGAYEYLIRWNVQWGATRDNGGHVAIFAGFAALTLEACPPYILPIVYE